MNNKIFRPATDKLFFIIAISGMTIMLLSTVASALSSALMLLVMVPMDLFMLYILISPLFGFVELREESLFIKFGVFMKRDIPYRKIRGLSSERKFYSDSMLSLKLSLDHVNIKYNTFDMVSVSVKNSDEFVRELKLRISTS